MDDLTTCLLTAKKAGSPRDQAERFVSRGYIPIPWQWYFHAAAREADLPNGPVEVVAGGARGPGKSHGIFAQAALDDAQRVEGLKILFLRKTAVSAKESFDDLIEKVISKKVVFSRSGNVINFTDNGSRIILGGFHNEDDIDKYVGIEYDVIVVEEMNQLTEAKIEKLRGSLRTSKTNWRPRLYGSFNPGGIGHAFVKSRYVIPFRTQSQTKTRFVPATYKQNPYLNREYIEYLEGLTGDLGKAWREGDFDIFAGQFFKEWRYDIHVVQPFVIHDDWRKFIAGDYGFSKPASLGWYAVSPDEKLYRYKELYGTGMHYALLAEQAVSLTNPNEHIEYQVFDPAFWAKKGEREDTLSGAEVYSQKWKHITGHLPYMVKADNSRVIGWGMVREYMNVFMGADEELTAKLQVFSTCTDFIRTIPEQQHDLNKPEDLDTDGEDHAADELRYAIMSRPKPIATKEQLSSKRFNEAMKRKKQLSRRNVFIT